MRAFWIALLLLFSAPAAMATAGNRTQVLVQVDLNANALRLEKVNGKRRLHLDGQTLPVVKESFHTGVFRPTKLYQRFRSINGNTYLENVIFFDGAHSIRTTRLFNRLARNRNPITGSVMLEPDFGMILFDTIKRFGAANTTIIIRK